MNSQVDAGSNPVPFRLTREEGGGEDDIPHPVLAVDFGVEAAGDVAGNTAGQSVQDDCR